MVASKEKLLKIKNQIIPEKLKDIKNIVLLKIFSFSFHQRLRTTVNININIKDLQF